MNTIIRTEKHCPSCKTTKQVSAFYKHRARADGLQSRCRICQDAHNRAWARAHPEGGNTRSRAWNQANPERRRATRRTIAARHVASRAKLTAAEIRATLAGRTFACIYCGEVLGPEGFHISRAEAQGLSRGCITCALQRRASHALSRPDLARAKATRRRAANRNAPMGERAPIVALEGQRWFVEAFVGEPVHLDHRDALALGGAHDAENLQWLPARINLSKHDMTHEEALVRVEGYREWTSDVPTFEKVTYVVQRGSRHPAACRDCRAAVGVGLQRAA